jgi:predicted O-methyltransferase YrrM
MHRRCTITVSSALDPGSRDLADSWLEENEHIRTARTRAEELGTEAASPSVAATLAFLASAIGAQAVVEVGTGTGVAAAALLSGMTNSGVLTSIDVEAEHQRVAREVLTALGYDHIRTRLIAGRALDVLPRLTDRAYDIVCVDADRSEYPAILAQASRLLREGGIVVFNGVLSDGRLADPTHRDAETTALRDVANELKDGDAWVPAMLTVGDGLLVAALRSPA